MNVNSKGLLFKLIVIMSLSFSIISFAESEDTLVSLYNSEKTLQGGGSTIAVLRQEGRKIELFSCTKRYESDFRDYNAVVAFFNEGLDSSRPSSIRTNCISVEKFPRNYGININKLAIKNSNSEVLRYIYTQSGSFVSDIAQISSDVTTWTVGVMSGLGLPRHHSLILTGARIVHDRSKNPVLNSYRDTYKLSGIAQIQYEELK